MADSPSKPPKVPVAVALSGGGRTLENLIEKSRSPDATYRVCAVISSNVKCRGNDIARAHGLPLYVGDFSTRADATKLFEQAKAVFDFLTANHAQYVLLAGFLKPFPLTPTWEGRVLNIHPALLPKFGGKGMYGIHVHRAVLAAHESMSGATVHLVSREYDEGAILGQALVLTEKFDTPETLASRVFAAECDLYPRVVNALISGALSVTKPEPLVYRFEDDHEGNH